MSFRFHKFDGLLRTNQTQAFYNWHNWENNCTTVNVDATQSAVIPIQTLKMISPPSSCTVGLQSSRESNDYHMHPKLGILPATEILAWSCLSSDYSKR